MNPPPQSRQNTGRPGLALGVSGQPWTTEKKGGGFTAAVWVRSANGKRRQVTASGKTKGAALRNLQRRLEKTVQPSAQGMQPNWPIRQAVRHWRKRLETTGGGRTRRLLKPQTLAGYDSEIVRIIDPAMGDVRLHEVTIPLVEGLLGALEQEGVSTERARDVLNGAFNLAVRDDAVRLNPMPYVALPAREPREVEVLTVPAAQLLLRVTHRDYRRTPGKRRPNHDLHDVVTTCLATGMRVGECVALRNQDVNLDSERATVTVAGTMVEPKKVPKSEWADPDVAEWYIAKHFRQGTTKTNEVRTLILPEAVAQRLRERRDTSRFTEPHHPLFASGNGHHLWAANIRTRLRAAIADEPTLVGTTPHTLRRTVASLVAYEFGLDAARMQLGHSLLGTTPLARYVAHREEVPDYTSAVDRIFTDAD
jgi:integrase